MYQLTDAGLTDVKCPFLHTVDISGCARVTSLGIRFLVQRNPNIHCLYLNHCRSLDDQALYDIAYYVGERLRSFDDFPPPVQFKIYGFNLRDIDLYGKYKGYSSRHY
ncbi:hypothetical protein COOONC_13450, partial [Cooperia oncophora]